MGIIALISFINLEHQYINIAQEKLKIYHNKLGDKIKNNATALDILSSDLTYVSSIFTFTDKSYIPQKENVICGGTGFDITSKLPQEVDKIILRNNWGFSTRGCIRKCKFCCVPKKEGYITAVSDIYDIWDGKSNEITLMDNNILAMPEHFLLITKQIQHQNLKVDFNQGLDIRLMDTDIAKLLSNIKHKEYHFAFDNVNNENVVYNGIQKLLRCGIRRSCFYVLVGCNTTIEDDLYRLNLLKKCGQNAYVMRYVKCIDEQPDSLINKTNAQIYTAIARWANNHAWFHGITFKEFLNRKENKNYLKHDVLAKIAA